MNLSLTLIILHPKHNNDAFNTTTTVTAVLQNVAKVVLLLVYTEKSDSA